MPYSMVVASDDCYEGTTVLISKLNIRDEQQLAENEALITGLKAAELLTRPLSPDFLFEDYKQIHRTLFEILYD